ncbi:MAG: hypothetical protein R3181_04535 [Rubricoccaceae bacterium]|nr:hypothetical protein [Rubricoccaceae bacterium]
MAVVSLFAFLFAAVVGGFMAYLHFTGGKSPLAASVVHGFFVAAGFIFLIVGLVKGDASAFGWWIVAAFVVVALGGAYLLSRHLRQEPWPGAVILAHGGAAVLALALLAYGLLG